MDRIAMHVEAKDGDKEQKLAYKKQVGAASSAFEHAVPERLFADPNKPLDDPSQPQGISAVKAIAIAASQGQRIYTFTAHNAAFYANILASLESNRRYPMLSSSDVTSTSASRTYSMRKHSAPEHDCSLGGSLKMGRLIVQPLRQGGQSGQLGKKE
ncbi:MAG: hypothetical protein AB1717_03530 [Pseudomonadota bacterium]